MNLKNEIEEMIARYDKHYACETNAYMARYWEAESSSEIRDFLRSSLTSIAKKTLEAVEKEIIALKKENPYDLLSEPGKYYIFNSALQQLQEKGQTYLGEK